MEENKNIPQAPAQEAPQTELTFLLEDMIENKVALSGDKADEKLTQKTSLKTPLDNLKSMLSQADAVAGVSPETNAANAATRRLKPINEENPIVNKPVVLAEDNISKAASLSDPVARLDGLIKAFKAGKL